MKYDVLEPLQHDGVRYEPGDSVEIAKKEQSEPLFNVGTIGKAGEWDRLQTSKESLVVKLRKSEELRLEFERENAKLKQEIADAQNPKVKTKGKEDAK